MGRSDSEDSLPAWRAFDGNAHGGRAFGVSLLVFSLPVLALLVAGAARTGWGAAVILVLLVAAVGIGTIDWRRDRRSATLIMVNGPDEFVVHQVDGRVANYSFGAVSRVVATRDGQDDGIMWMRISVGGRTVRTRSGLADTASTFLAMCEEAGAAVTHKTYVAD